MSLSARALALRGMGYGPAAMALLGLAAIAAITPAQTPASSASSGSGTRVVSLNRGGDPHAYDSDRVRDRLQAVVINGRSFDPLTDDLLAALEAASQQPIEADDELSRQTEKLARVFTVHTPTKQVLVPMFRPMLDELPNFKTALAADFEAYAKKAALAVEEERRRIVLLLLDDW